MYDWPHFVLTSFILAADYIIYIDRFHLILITATDNNSH